MVQFSPLAQIAIVCVAFTINISSYASVTSLGSCSDDLEKLHKVASEASEAANHAKSKGDDFDECRNDPQTYDLMHDRCKSLDDDYQSALSDLEGKMDEVDDSVRSVQDSCGYQFTINRLTPLETSQKRLEAAQRRLCTSYHNLIDLGIPRDTVLQMCKAHADEQSCRQCLGSK
ncbi:MAG TPA: hypothetical protein VN950_13110 [Terriglobales bacterium]|jgi:hypothetical protein|nr:hypothetical protein [Terriglobales bacterium]